jgi:hypothetical protein
MERGDIGDLAEVSPHYVRTKLDSGQNSEPGDFGLCISHSSSLSAPRATILRALPCYAASWAIACPTNRKSRVLRAPQSAEKSLVETNPVPEEPTPE